MGFLRNLAVGGALSVGAALALGWSGLRRLPAPFAPYPAKPDSPATGPFPAGLPAPVERCFRAMLGDRVGFAGLAVAFAAFAASDGFEPVTALAPTVTFAPPVTFAAPVAFALPVAFVFLLAFGASGALGTSLPGMATAG